MFDSFLAWLGIPGVVLVVGLVLWIVWRVVVAWRDTNGNGVIDEDE